MKSLVEVPGSEAGGEDNDGQRENQFEVFYKSPLVDPWKPRRRARMLVKGQSDVKSFLSDQYWLEQCVRK